MKTKKPWLDHRGRELPKSKLLEISKEWDLATWTEYAESLETNSPGKEISYKNGRVCEDKIVTDLFGNLPSAGRISHLRKKIFSAIKKLSLRQRQVIKFIFFNGKTTEETAEILKISKQTVSEYKQSALIRLKKFLSEDPDISSSYVGTSDYSNSMDSSISDIHEVMNSEISRFGQSRTNFYRED